MDPTPDPSPEPPRWGRRRRPSSAGVPWLPLAVVAVLLAGGGWWWFVWRAPEPVVGPEVPSPEAAGTLPADPSAEPPPPPLDLPPLGESDGLVADLVGMLSRHPVWARWLVSDDLAARFVGAVVAVAAGVSPAQQVPFMAPSGPFTTRPGGGGESIDPASYARYDPLVDAFVSFDTPGAVRLYRQMLPLFDEAHRALGFPPGTFGETMAAALARILAVQVPESPPSVMLDVKTYLLTDPGLEALTPAEKHVLRLGPDNAAQVQQKLRQLRDALVRAGALPPS